MECDGETEIDMFTASLADADVSKLMYIDVDNDVDADVDADVDVVDGDVVDGDLSMVISSPLHLHRSLPLVGPVALVVLLDEALPSQSKVFRYSFRVLPFEPAVLLPPPPPLLSHPPILHRKETCRVVVARAPPPVDDLDGGEDHADDIKGAGPADGQEEFGEGVLLADDVQ
ncbi:uncharacterized protein SPSK_02779 [Sporothrix schenckii 1099-18]|uniref:Uncharacterized protein n=1 Tax=Sporothrix schenckii 1099-18 TaxID=1397361 RepID=A0A0F2MCG6_SPOSC|nr:uncharacterized protein SPSK_02779 [Sporothrix schenckii 1099-18]KJR86510.1 hypothetical protein SPSK_02779 [Sporothrix schenckii 1099-18]